MKNNLLDGIDDIITIIESSDEYKKYQLLVKKMHNNKEITNLISEVKTLQQKLVKEEALGNDIKDIDNEIKEKLNKLKEYPIYLEYTYLQEDLNNSILLVKEKLEKYINDLTNKEVNYGWNYISK